MAVNLNSDQDLLAWKTKIYKWSISGIILQDEKDINILEKKGE
jgi:hypothetical protein